MQSLKTILTFLCCILCIQWAYGQTPFLSQNFAATRFFNPASVGFGVNNQFTSFYKNQFSGVGDPYKTIGLGADFKLFKQLEGESNHFGMGVQAVSEKVLNGVLQTNYISLQIANRIFLNKQESSYLSLGIGGTLVSRNIDRELLSFGDQYNSGRLYYGSSAESIASIPLQFASSVGLLFGSHNPVHFLQIGASGYYISRNTFHQSFSEVNQNFQLIGLANFEHQLGYDKTILFHMDYQTRSEASYVYGGMAIGFPIHDSFEKVKRFYIGCFYRSQDATIPYLGILLGKYTFGMSYDIYQNNMTTANLHPQTIEFNLSTLIGGKKTENLVSLFN
ncbi:MAG: hypothetical protein RLZ56_1218 [Bacteroidota bacterium]|jgi:type IX secretion system PorP/SprF family membrane protein